MSQQKIPVVDVTSGSGGSAQTKMSPVAEIWDPDGTVTTDDNLPSESRRKFLKKSAGVTTASLVGTAALVTGSDVLRCVRILYGILQTRTHHQMTSVCHEALCQHHFHQPV